MSSSESSPPDNASVLRDLWRVISRFRGRILLALAFLILAKLAVVSVPLALKRIVDELSRPEQFTTLPIVLLVGYALLRFASTLFNELRDLAFSRVTQYTVATYALNTFTHLHALGARFHSSRRLGGLLPDIDRGTSGIAFLLGVGLFTIVPTLLEIGMVTAIISARYSGWFTAALAVTFMIYCGFTLVFTARRAIFQRRVNRLDSNAKSIMADSLINHDTVKYFTNEKLESSRFQHIMDNWAEAVVGNQKALFILHIGQSGIIAMGVASVMLLAGQSVMTGAMTVGDLILVNAYVIQICLPLNALGFVYREAKDALVNAEKLFQLLRQRPEIDEPANMPALRVSRGEVVFNDVSFGYTPERPILKNVSFRIPAGGTVAVVGGSGSGKSTLARLLLRLYDVSDGHIDIDHQDIRGVTTRSLREAIGVVPQETLLFNDTIAYNIAYGRSGATHEQIVAAARAAHIHELIDSLPQQYDTPVGERGVMLSGGEKQRIALARAILKNPPLLIFDEATSALDTQSERAILSELNRLSENRTTLVIAHRLSTVVDADEILVMERGRIVERGTHMRLLAQGGMYARLWQLQERSAEVEDAEKNLQVVH
ncbi:MAG TPA: ABC transporter ATP-binding protein/permease [Noviherbaspirillum sp.]|jgi:ATP-binding cassette subfamily B protein|uniref:ABCB family ABC transporter ATP-binding protein/permease n=1 Tax=Noviherbaspirillum sp. TaxID=1926288 RepID=UPI002DDD835C|nr:ABC transporter ATP-binding protein/permease [Noviherbaspirillum sp.]HEV2609371.1 ABC transporter ATP-binding protein/permease [Noviherbaspirillum sp.]